MKPATRGVAWALMVALALGGCQTAGNRDALTPEQQALREQADQFNSTVGEGALIGAVGGALLGALLDSGNRGRGAALGAAAGAALGGGAGYYVATQNERYATREQALDAKIRAADQEVQRYQAAVNNAKGVVSLQQRRLAQLRQQARAGQVSQAQYQAQISQAQADAAAIQRLVEGNQQAAQAMQQDITALRGQGENTRALELRLAELQRTQRELRSQHDQITNSMALG